MFSARSLLGQTPSPSPGGPTPSADSKASPSTFSAPCGRALDVADVVDQYAALTRLRVIRDNFVQGKVCIDDLTGVPRQKAIEIIERTLFSDGYPIVQIDSGTVQIVGAGQNPRSVGLPVISDPKDLPKQERLISYVLHFKHRDAAEMQQLMGQYCSPPRAYTSMLAESKGSNTVVVTERSSVIRSLLEIAKRLDVPGKPKEP